MYSPVTKPVEKKKTKKYIIVSLRQAVNVFAHESCEQTGPRRCFQTVTTCSFSWLWNGCEKTPQTGVPISPGQRFGNVTFWPLADRSMPPRRNRTTRGLPPHRFLPGVGLLLSMSILKEVFLGGRFVR